MAQLGIFLSIIEKLSPHRLPRAHTVANTSEAENLSEKLFAREKNTSRERGKLRVRERELSRILSRLYDNCPPSMKAKKSFSISFFTLVLVWPELISTFSPKKISFGSNFFHELFYFWLSTLYDPRAALDGMENL